MEWFIGRILFCILLTVFYVHIITTFIQIYKTNKTHGFKTYQQITWLIKKSKVHRTTKLLVNYNCKRKIMRELISVLIY